MSEDEPNKNLPTTADRAQEPAPLSSAEDIASSTLSSTSICGFGGLEAGTGRANLIKVFNTFKPRATNKSCAQITTDTRAAA